MIGVGNYYADEAEKTDEGCLCGFCIEAECLV
jgi:hypothetical protein